MERGPPVISLLKTVFESIFEVFLLCLAGYILARRGTLDRVTQKKLNRLNVSLFTPALLFSKVAFFLSPEKLRELWVIPIVFFVTTIVSMVAAFLLGWLCGLKRSQRSFAIASAMFMNSNSLPIALMQSLVVTVPGLKWGDDDNEDAMVGRALTYLVLYSTLGMVVRWSYGVRLLSQADPEGVEIHEEPQPTVHRPLFDRDEVPFPPAEAEQRIHRHEGGLPIVSPAETPTDTECPSISVQGPQDSAPKFFYSFPNSPSVHSTRLPQGSSSSSVSMNNGDEEEEGEERVEVVQQRRRDPITPTSSRFQSYIRRFKHRSKKTFRTFKEFMTVPLWAALASLVVACIRPLQHILEVHASPIKGALNGAGNVSIPMTLVVLGAYFYTPLSEEEIEERERSRQALLAGYQHHCGLADTRDAEEGRGRRRTISTKLSQMSLVDNVKEMFKLPTRRKCTSRERSRKKEEGRPGETKTVVIAIMARMVITPLLLLPVMAVGARWDLQKVFEDPIFVVSNVLLISSPPALTLAQITQAASGDAFERLISKTIVWSYCVVTPPSTIVCVVLGLLLSKL